MISKIAQSKSFFDQVEDGLYGKKNVEDSLALLYHENSKLNRFNQRALAERIGMFYSPFITERSSQPYKHYPGAEKVDLSIYNDLPLPSFDLFSSLLNRRSVRSFDPEYKISERELHILLRHSYGVTRKEKISDIDGHQGFRPTPSPGGLFSLELYIILFKGQIKQGIYHFRPDEMSLELVAEGNFIEACDEIINSSPWEGMMQSVSGIVVTTGIFERLAIKYGERAYRFMIHESGFVAQNMSVISSAIGLGSCMLGGYQDEKLNELIGVDGVFETVHNIMVFGKPSSEKKEA